MSNEAKMMIRLPLDVRDWFVSYSRRNQRSMNGQMVAMIVAAREAEKENAPEGESSEALDAVNPV